MGSETGNLIAHTLGGGDGNFINETFVGVKVESEAGVVFLNNGPCGLFDGFGTDSLRAKKDWTRLDDMLMKQVTYCRERIAMLLLHMDSWWRTRIANPEVWVHGCVRGGK